MRRGRRRSRGSANTNDPRWRSGGRRILRDQPGEGDLGRAGHVVSPEPLGSKASVLMRRSRQLGCSTLIISTASIEHSSQIRACGPATSCITSLCFLPQNEQAGVLIVAFELSLVGPITAGEGGHARSSRRSGREGSRQKPKTRVLLGFLSFLAEGVGFEPTVPLRARRFSRPVP